jgi:hypothetical protein
MKEVGFAGLDRGADGSPVAFELVCACGAALRGVREAWPQTIACPACGAKRFVLPRSVLPEVKIGGDRTVTASPRKVRPWVAGTVLLVGICILASLMVFQRNDAPDAGPRLTNQELFDQHLAAGSAAVTEGAFRKASRELATALKIAEALPARLPVARRRQIEQQQREAAILGDLLSESLAEIAKQATGLPDHEWQEIFQQRYAGRSFVLDDTVHRDAAGRYHHNLKFVVVNTAMKLDLGQVKILQSLPQLNRPQRVLLGLRVAGLRREASGWSVVLDPDGGVLLTDTEMVSSLSVPIDAELREVLNRQKVWLEFLP